MACPLKAILNTEDCSPRKAPGQNVTTRGLEAPGPLGVQQADRSTPTPIISKTVSYGYPPPFALSSNRGALYHRRTSRSPQRIPTLPTPPASDSPRIKDRPVHWVEPGPPSHETNTNRFSVFQALLSYPELTFEVAKQLDVEDLISLYAISKEFHLMLDSRFTTMILSQSLGKAAESSRTFLFKCYRNLCTYDPGARPNLEIPGQVRHVPSFRWLRMVLFREKVVHEIIACLAAEGHFLPKRASLVIKKIWFMMDIPDNLRRIGLIHNKTFWEDRDLFVATWFFIKLDMFLTDPVDGNGETRLRKMLFAQRSLSILWKVLKREQMATPYEMMQMFVRWRYHPEPRHRGMSICGVPANKLGTGELEGWGTGTAVLLRPDELVMREAIRRKMGLHQKYMDMMLWGYIDKKTGEDIWATENDVEEGSSMSETDEDAGEGSEKAEDEEEQDQVDYTAFDLG
ncbi:MAG: hypothetical protein LQ347_003111 [Umbilicaria vellea]|nr:MAG: hypothetical protein LQ347_003111 [Umbilicaria vellea]